MSHALYPPSAMARIIACPPSGPLSANLPERTNVKAEEGTRVHEVIKTSLTTGKDPEAFPWTVANVKGNLPDHEVVARVRAYLAQLGPGQLLTEHMVYLNDSVWGTLDIGHIPQADIPNIITVFDYKNGGYDVQAKNNKQLLTYAATFLDRFPTVQWFRLVIFQPNSWGAGDSAEYGFKQHPHSRAEVEAHRREVLQAVSYQGPPRPGPHCRWCPAFSQCPAMSQDAYFLMAAISRDPTTLTPAELVRMLRIVRSLGDMKDTLEGYLTAMLKAGAQVDGASLKKSTKWEQWNDERHAIQTLFNAYGVRGVKALSVSQAKKLGSIGEQYASVAAHRPEPEMKASY